MRAARRYWVWLAVFYAGMLAIIGAFALVAGAGLDETHRSSMSAMLAESGPALIYAAGILLFICAGVLGWVFRRYPQAAHQLADQTRVLLAASPGQTVASNGGPEMVELAAVINQLADGYQRLERDLDAKAAEARARVEEERNRFAALMSELSEGVVVCNADGRILLYNAVAANLVGSAEARSARGSFTPLGLGRSVFGLLERDQVAHALDKIHQQLERNVERPHTRFVTGAANGSVLRVQVAPFLSAERRVAGMVFTLDDVSGLIGREGQRLKLLQALSTGIRAPVANLRAVAESLVAYPEMDVARRTQFVEIVAAESRVLTERLNAALNEYADALKGSLTLEDMRVVDLLTVVERRSAGRRGDSCTHRGCG